jgi:hypothetical protein
LRFLCITMHSKPNIPDEKHGLIEKYLFLL